MSSDYLFNGCEFLILLSLLYKALYVLFFFQKSNRGRIGFNDFKTFMINLKTWQSVFKMHTREKTGILRAERLRDALFDVGFQLNTEILTVLILR